MSYFRMVLSSRMYGNHRTTRIIPARFAGYSRINCICPECPQC